MKKILFIIYIVVILLFVKLNAAEEENRKDTFIKKALDRISPSVVKVVTQNHRRYIATGVAIEKDLVLSNIMVLNHPFDRIFIETVKGKILDVKIVGKDKNSSLILLKTKGKVLKPVKRGKLPGTGEWIGLVGVFYKQFPFLNQGIISSKSSTDLILNATVAPGSTGGAVVNRRGELIGIIRGVFGYKFFPQYTFKDDHSELKIASSVRGGNDLCYAIPVKQAFRIADDLEEFGHVKRGWLGVNISSDPRGFVRVDSIVKTSPAETGGIRAGDIINDISGKKIKTPLHLSESIKMLRPGDKIVVELARKGKQIKVKVELADLEIREKKLFKIKEKVLADRISKMPELIETMPKIPNYTFEFTENLGLGVDVLPLTPELAKEFKIKSGGGLLVSKIKSGNEKESQFKIGDILINSNGVKLTKISDLAASLKKGKSEKKLVIKLIRKGKTIEKTVKPSVISLRSRMLENFNRKFRDARFWMEKQQQLKMKEELEKLKELKLRKNAVRNKEKKMILEEIEKRKLESLEKYRKEIEQLIKEKKAVEEELKKLKKKKDDPGRPIA
ncbi:MAG: PDZ domain-containing protein [Acidobacteriota bacterium]